MGRQCEILQTFRQETFVPFFIWKNLAPLLTDASVICVPFAL